MNMKEVLDLSLRYQAPMNTACSTITYYSAILLYKSLSVELNLGSYAHNYG